jgi:hypothetical protein
MCFRSILLAFVLACSASAPSGAADAPPTVDVTFRLTLYGVVPATDTFELGFAWCTPGRPCEGWAGIAIFCGKGSIPTIPTPGPCKGNGTVYVETIAVPLGDRLDFSILRRLEEMEAIDTLRSGQAIVNRDTTISVSYRYPEKAPVKEMPAEWPASGAGGLARLGCR